MDSISKLNEKCKRRRENRKANIPSTGAEASVATSFRGSGALVTASPPIASALSLSLTSSSSGRAGTGSGAATSGRGAAVVFASSDMVLSRNKNGAEKAREAKKRSGQDASDRLQ
jgi:hypothetical protein